MQNKIFNFRYQRGGMLLELMLSVALAAVVIPFIFRYQQNTIERARNISVIKQMGLVSDALERCIFENRDKLANMAVNTEYTFSEADFNPNSEDGIDCLILANENGRGLINYGLTPEFANDFMNDYRLRILKYKNGSQPIFQGVVLSSGVDALRTAEITRLGGGSIGFIEKTNVLGGYGVFKTTKSKLKFNTVSGGLVQITGPTRGESKYLWRVWSGNKNDATMLSPLNMDEHDIVNVDALYAKNVNFYSELKINGDLNISELTFDKYANFGTTQIAGTAGGTINVTRGADPELEGVILSGNNSAELNITNLYLNDNANVNVDEFDVNTLYVKDECKFPITGVTANKLVVNNDVAAGSVDASTGIIKLNDAAVTPILNIDKIIYEAKNNNPEYTWGFVSGKTSRAQFKDLILSDLTNLVALVKNYEQTHVSVTAPSVNNTYNLYTDQIWTPGDSENDVVSDYLFKMQFIKDVVDAKYACASDKDYYPNQMYPGGGTLYPQFSRCVGCVTWFFNCVKSGKYSYTWCKNGLNYCQSDDGCINQTDISVDTCMDNLNIG